VRILKHLLWHLSAKQYRVWMFASDAATLSANAGKFLSLWLAQVTPLIFGLGALGVFALMRQSRSRLGFLALVFAIHTFFALNYSIPDIDSYFIPAFLVWALLCGEGVAWLLGLLARKAHSPGLIRAARLVLPLVFLAPLFANWKGNDLSRNYLPYDFGRNALASTEPGALVLTVNWDMYSPILYIQNIEGTRRDVVMVDKELLRRSWYFKYLGERHPWLIEGSRREVESYLALLDEFEAGTLKDNNEIQRRFIVLINRFIHLGLAEGRPVYLAYNQAMDQTDYPGTAPDMVRIPCGLLYRLLPGDSLVASRPAFELRGVFDPGIYKDDRTRVNLMNYPRMGFERAMFLATHRRYAEAVDILRGLLSWPIKRATVLRALGGCELEAGNLDEAQGAFEEMLRENPLDPVAKSGLEEILRRRQAAPGGGK
jgi:tetratricopeptide (TPR) repeat protein